MQGIVIKSTGSNYEVLAGDKTFTCKIKGSFKLKAIDSTNPVVVGDRVLLETSNRIPTGWIGEILPRRNYIIRKAVNLSRQSHILASNLDFAFVIATPVMPRTSTGFIDRFLAAAESYSIPAGIIFNKSDLYDSEIHEYILELTGLYASIGYACYTVAANVLPSLENLLNFLQNKTTLFAGHSGVGKSTLINALIPGLGLKTAPISDAHLKGTHTTTFAQMHALPQGGFIIDTPGIREFGFLEDNPAFISHYFPEIFKQASSCRFSDCLHVSESGCAVAAAVRENQISTSRYESYLSILQNRDSFR